MRRQMNPALIVDIALLVFPSHGARLEPRQAACVRSDAQGLVRFVEVAAERQDLPLCPGEARGRGELRRLARRDLQRRVFGQDQSRSRQTVADGERTASQRQVAGA